MSVRANHLNDLVKQIEYYFNVMLQNKDATQFKGISLDALVFFPMISERLQNKTHPKEELVEALALSKLLKLDEDSIHVVHVSRPSSVAVLSRQERLALALQHLFTPILFYYDTPLRTTHQNAGKITVSNLLKEKFTLEDVSEFFRSKHSLPIEFVDDQFIRIAFPMPPARNVVKSALGQSLSASLFPSASLADRTFTVMTYNILADTLHQMTMAKNSSQNAFDRWTHVIISEILYHLPDILLLQEVQVASNASLNHLDFFDTHLTKRGYHGLCLSSFAFLTPLPKPGVCVYWKSDLYQEVESEKVFFPDFLTKFSKDIQDRYVSHHCALIVALRSKLTRHITIVCTTHIWCNYSAPDTQIVQKIAEMKQKYPNCSVIFGGDFNSQPQSGVYQFISDGKLALSHPDLLYPLKYKLALPISLDHSLQLASSYKSVLSQEPKLTNKHYDFSGCLDYLWYSTNTLSPLSIVDMPNLQQTPNLPNEYYPSDHVSLVARLCVHEDVVKRDAPTISTTKRKRASRDSSSSDTTSSLSGSDDDSSESSSDVSANLELNIY